MIRRRTFLFLAMAGSVGFSSAPCWATDIVGAGATFPYPVYAAWAEAYKKETGINVAYQAIGSGGGIAQIKARTVTFAGSDIPLSPEEAEQSGLIQFPIVYGGIVPVVNLKGVKSGQIKLDGPTLAAIFLGSITTWDAPAIAALNPGVALPAIPILPVTRSDSSGTNFIFTRYLSEVSPAFKERVGAAPTVTWPHAVGAHGNEGVAEKTAQVEGAIGYVEYFYAKDHEMTHASMINAAGKTVAPGEASFRDAISPGQSSPSAWPIVGASFVLLSKRPQDPIAAQNALRFFAWAYTAGRTTAESLNYVPLPPEAVAQIEKTWADAVRGPDAKALWASQ